MATIARRRVREHGLGVLLWRWFTGHPHHGKALTDAGWSRPGVKALSDTGHVRRWWYRPRGYRAAVRTWWTLAVLATLWGLLFARLATLILLAVAAASGAAWGCWRVVSWVRDWRHHRTWIAPAHLVAAPLLGIPVASDPREWLEVAPDRSRVVAALPPGYNPDAAAKARLLGTLSAKLGLEAPEARWALAGPRPRLEITQSEPPPSLVTLADVREQLDRLKPDEILWGLGKKRVPVKSSLSGDSPHFGLSMGSGAGKSVTSRSLLAQMLMRGAIGIILDVKYISHPWAMTLPNVVIVRRAAEIHAMMCWLGREMERRNEVALAGVDEDGEIHADVGPRIIIIGEELNAAMDKLRAYWRDAREKSDPVRSPALTAFDSISYMGRQAKVNVVYIGQRLDNRATGGSGSVRENIGVIAFARYKAATWKMLADGHPMPPPDLTPGRLHVVSDQVQVVQGVKMSAAEARELSLSGTVSALPWDMPGAPRATAEAGDRLALNPAPGLRGATAPAAPGPLPVSGWVTLREAVGVGILGDLKLAGARTARHRDEKFPRPLGRDGTTELYDPMALASWAASRKE